MRSFALLLASGLAMGWTAATAAPARKTSPPLDPPMQIHVVRSGHPGCEPRCLKWIAAQGKIGANSVRQFKKVLGQLGDRKLPILIDSNGGSVLDALAIGRLVRGKGLDVVVSKTVFTPCAPENVACRKNKTGGELRGLTQTRLSRCASSCAFILAGGVHRFVGQGTGVGVHQIALIMRRYMILTRHSFGIPVGRRNTLVSEQKVGEKNAQVRNAYTNIRDYFAEMGIDEGIMPLIKATPNDKVHWLTADELRSTRLATHFINGEQLITGVLTSKPTAEPAPKPPLTFQDYCAKVPSLAGVCPKKSETGVPAPNRPAVAPSASPEQ